MVLPRKQHSALIVISILCSTHAQLTCSRQSDTAIELSWPSQPHVDMYGVAASTSKDTRPVVLVTSSNTTAIVADLLPSQSYYFRLQWHDASAPAVVAGWTYASAITACSTSTMAAKVRLIRTNGVSADKISMSVVSDLPLDAAVVRFTRLGDRHEHAYNSVLFARAPVHNSRSIDLALSALQSTRSNLLRANATARNLIQNSTYLVELGLQCVDNTCAEWRYPTLQHTTAVDSNNSFTEMFRLSEYTFEVDFLPNHNSADRVAMGAYITQGTPLATNTHWPNSTAEDWHRCQATLAELCPHERLAGLPCMNCATTNYDKVAAVCGNFTSEDNDNEGFSVHFYCGIGWPESVILNSSVTRYCVEHASVTDPRVPSNDGFAQYVSCNSDETDYFGNAPRDPLCICWVYDDRILSQQSNSSLHHTCDFEHKEPYVNEVQCNCGDRGPLLLPDDPSARFVGKSDVYLPYGYWLNRSPPEKYPMSVPAGENFSTPKAGQCGMGQAIGHNGCTWRRHASMQMIYGPDLLAHGWDVNAPPDTLTNFTGTQHNMDTFAKTVEALNDKISLRCCGC